MTADWDGTSGSKTLQFLSGTLEIPTSESGTEVLTGLLPEMSVGFADWPEGNFIATNAAEIRIKKTRRINLPLHEN